MLITGANLGPSKNEIAHMFLGGSNLGHGHCNKMKKQQTLLKISEIHQVRTIFKDLLKHAIQFNSFYLLVSCATNQLIIRALQRRTP